MSYVADGSHPGRLSVYSAASRLGHGKRGGKVAVHNSLYSRLREIKAPNLTALAVLPFRVTQKGSF